jgi:hypothetical protein
MKQLVIHFVYVFAKAKDFESSGLDRKESFAIESSKGIMVIQ